MTTILEALQNAKFNLIDNGGVGLPGIIGRKQLANAVILLEKEFPIDYVMDGVMDAFPNLNDAPDFQHYKPDFGEDA